MPAFQVEEGSQELEALREHCAQLERQLDERDKELSSLRILAAAVADGDEHDVHGAKVVELSRKNRALNLAYEKEKTRANKFKSQVEVLQQQLAAEKDSTSKSQRRGSISGEQAEVLARGVAEWKEKAGQAHQRLAEAQAMISATRGECARLQRALQKEVGEDVPLARVLEEGGDWKGRAQQISLLKDKVRELRSKLAQQPGADSDSVTGTSGRPSSLFEQHRETLEALEEKRRRESEHVGAELAQAREELSRLKLKHDAAVSRRSTLEGEVRGLKDKLAVVLNKTANDDRLVSALRAENASLKKTARRSSLNVPSERTSTAGDEQRLAAQYSELKYKYSEQEKKLKAQEKAIEALQELASASKPDREETAQELRRVEVERDKLAKLVAVLRSQVQESEQHKDHVGRLLQLERIRAVELERRCEAGSKVPLSRRSSP